ncbi:MAG: DUF3846 domain-containing protein [Coriobacteriales bacterium]|jgi:hypothetical protein
MKTWKVVVAEPGKKAEVREIPATYKALADLVGGPLEVTDPISDDTAVICNEMGKLIGLAPNRGMYSSDGKLHDVYFGTIVFIGARPDDEDFSSLTDMEAALYLMIYGDPEFSASEEDPKNGR